MTARLSTRGRIVIPSRLRQALRLRPGDRVAIRLEGGRLVVQSEGYSRARLVEEKGRKVLVAPRGAPPMTPERLNGLLTEFP